MTGEMGWNDLKDYPEILALAKKIKSGAKVAAEVRPFDVYQGPYIAVDMRSLPTRKTRFGSWQIDVWYADVPGKFVMDYQHKFSKAMTASEIVKKVKEIKAKGV